MGNKHLLSQSLY